MLPIKFIRENPQIVRADLQKRQDQEKLGWVDLILKKDEEYRMLLQKQEEFRAQRNKVTQAINELKKAKKDASSKITEAQQFPEKVKDLTAQTERVQEELTFYLMRIPNLLHESVPVGKDSSENVMVRIYGKAAKPSFELKSHGQLLEEKNLADFESAGKIAGHGFYFLKGNLALLEHALQRFAIDTLSKKGFCLIQPPLMMRRKPYEGVTDLADFETMMYKVQDEDLYLIATSEHPIGAMHQNRVFLEHDLPVRYVGLSPCFRKELGSHGVDERGLFRVHQFNKIEQFAYCRPEDSWEIHEELIKNAEELFQELKLPYRIVNICTGDIGTVAAKKYDLEVWMPREGEYKEAVSCSNCTAYQAARLNIKYQKGAEKMFVHTLNSTAIATSRALRAILENFQQEDGRVLVPKALQGHMNGLKEI